MANPINNLPSKSVSSRGNAKGPPMKVKGGQCKMCGKPKDKCRC